MNPVPTNPLADDLATAPIDDSVTFISGSKVYIYIYIYIYPGEVQKVTSEYHIWSNIHLVLQTSILGLGLD